MHPDNEIDAFVNGIQKERHRDIMDLPYWVEQVETLEEIN